MNIVFSKNKKKRSRSSSSEANTSFVKNLTSRVSGLLPATITKWFSSPSSSNTNGSAVTADATDSSTEDEAAEGPLAQPPSKRMRYTSPTQSNHYPPTDTNNVTANIDTLEPCNTYSTVQSPPGRTTFRRETNFVSTPLRSPTEESTIEKSEKDSTMFKSQHSVSTIGASVATKRKSLFDSPSRNEASKMACAKTSCNTMRDPNEPCFKPSLLGSPFYPGRTMYGGASASYINRPNIKQRKNTLVNEINSSENNTISHSARRIMDLLEHYSSPLNEAKRIPQYVRSPKGNSPSSSLESPSSYNNNVLSYKTQELHVPSIASILRLKQRSRLMDTTTAARQIIATHSSMSGYIPFPVSNTQRKPTEHESSNKLTTKVKSRLTRPKRGDTVDVETSLPTPINLPSATLQIDQDKLPKFSFGMPAVSNVASSSTSTRTFTMTETKTHLSETKTTADISETPLRKPETVSSSNPYTFSSPVRISSPSESVSSSTLSTFTFGSPERSIDKANVQEKKDDDSSCFVGTSKETDKPKIPSKTEDWQCPSCWVFNKTDVEKCVCCETHKPSEDDSKKPAKCSVCKVADTRTGVDKCISCELIKVNNVSRPPAIKPTVLSKWKCEDCVNNDENAGSCDCYGSKIPKKIAPVKQNAVTNTSESEWKCEDCWIKNKSTVDKCAACGGAKPGVKQSSAPVPAVSSLTSFSSTTPVIKAQSEKWECTSCLVRNDNDTNKCVCCETERLPSAKEPEKKSFNFGLCSTFKFGINPKFQDARAKPTETNTTSEAKAKVEESETNNNVLAKTPSFTFGVPAKKSEDQTDNAKKVEEKTGSVPKTNFTFGIHKSTAAAVPIVNKLPEPTFKTVPEEKENLQEVPKVDFTTPITVGAPKLPIFTPPLKSPVNQNKPISAPLLNSSITFEKKDPNVSLRLAAVTSTETAQPPTFTFATAVVKSPVPLFGVSALASTTAPAATTVMSFASPVQSAPVTSTVSLFQKIEPTTTTAAISMFPKSVSANNTTVSLFQKSEPSTTAPPSLGATAPMFSFGTNSQITLSQPDKPKFSFTFGSNNKTETPSMFKPTFGAPADSTGSNKFTLPIGNTMGNALSGNTLGGSNGLSTATSLMGNVLSGGNTLAINPLRGGSEMSNPLMSGNGLQNDNVLPAPAEGIFGTSTQKENIWSSNQSNNSNSLFVTKAPANSLQKPAAFTFGSSTPFNATSVTPTFGNVAQPTPNVFGMSHGSNNQGSMFSSPVQNQTTPSLFATPQPASNPAPAMGMFGTPSVGATPTFGVPNPSIPPFEAPSLTPAPAPSFNFGAQSTGMFGFGQQQQQPQQSPGVYSFGAGAPAGGAPQVQFNMGSAPNTRRMRKAVRRIPQR